MDSIVSQNSPLIRKLTEPIGPGEDYFVSPEKLIIGNPRQTIWTQYEDAGKKFIVGHWRSEPGKWRIKYTEEEYCHMLEGKSIIQSNDGETTTVQAGDSFVISSGFDGTWEVILTTTKRFVIYDKCL
jgi:uncharacterized cupin superfamily protein